MLDQVKDYYGKTLSGSADLKTDACCTLDAPPDFLREIIDKVHPEVANRYYGCGLVAPELLKGARILDLGSGSGYDCYILSALVGEEGQVVGVDMTDEQLAVAEAYRQYHAQEFGFSKPNTRFIKGYLERLDELDLDSSSFDVIVSNCVINLSPDKEAVLKQAFRLLKPGGELYFSDVYSDRRVPELLRDDPVLYGECLSGALYWNDFLHLARRCGFADPRLVTDRSLQITNTAVEAKVGDIGFYSATYRLFKLDDLEPGAEDYGQAVIYQGTVPDAPEEFVLDGKHKFITGQSRPVSGNTWRILQGSRFCQHFEFTGDFSQHLGVFESSGQTLPFSVDTPAPSGGCCG